MKFLLAFICSTALLYPQWTKVERIPDVDIYSLYSSGASLYAGGNGYVYISSDSGASWRKSAQVYPDADAVTALLKTGNTLIAGTYGYGVLISTDEGNTWTPKNSGLTGLGSKDISAFAESRGKIFAATIGASIFYTTLADTEWHSYNYGIPMGISGNTWCLLALNDTLLAGAGGNASVYVNYPQAEFWEEIPFSQVNGEPVMMFDMDRSGNGIVGVASYGIFKTGNLLEWSPLISYNIVTEGAVSKYGSDLFIAASQTGRTKIYRYYGETGNVALIDSLFPVEVISTLTYGNRLYTGRISGGLWYREFEPLAVEPQPVILGYMLHNNYPNPFNPSTKIKFTIPERGYTTLSVYDVLGNKIQNIASADMEAGSYEYEFNASGLAAGIYFYRLSSGGYSAVNKMILLK